MFVGKEREEKLNRKDELLQELNQHVSFSVLAGEIDRVAPYPDKKQVIRVLVLQHLYGLSDDAWSISYWIAYRFSAFVV